MVCGANPSGDQATTPRYAGQRHIDRLLPLRFDEGIGSARQGTHASPQNAEHMVLECENRSFSSYLPLTEPQKADSHPKRQ